MVSQPLNIKRDLHEASPKASHCASAGSNGETKAVREQEPKPTEEKAHEESKEEREVVAKRNAICESSDEDGVKQNRHKPMIAVGETTTAGAGSPASTRFWSETSLYEGRTTRSEA